MTKTPFPTSTLEDYVHASWPFVLDAAASLEAQHFEIALPDGRVFEVTIDGPGARAFVSARFRLNVAELIASSDMSDADKEALRARFIEMRHQERESMVNDDFPYNAPEFVRPIIAGILAREPELSSHGFGKFRPSDDLDAMRADALTDESCREFERALEWLMRMKPTASLNRKIGSYSYKHEAERWFRSVFSGEGYVANGMLIVAAIHLGLKVKRISKGSPNAYINLPARRPGVTGLGT